jgi:3-hydroxyisobutyrate dehydrogenase
MTADLPTIGFVGLGDLGMPIAARLLECGHRVVAWNRSPGPLEVLVGRGAVPASSPANVTQQAGLIALCLSSAKAVEAVTFGVDGLLSAHAATGAVIADLTTGTPEDARALAARAAERNVGWVDAPVSGGPPAAEQGTLVIFAGGRSQDVTALRPMFRSMSIQATHMGESGAGQATKLCSQMVFAGNLMIMAEMIVLARRIGIDVERLPGALHGGFADSKPMQIFGPRMARQEFEPRLGSLGLLQDTVRMIQDMAATSDAVTPMLDKAAALYRAAGGSPACPADGDVSRLVMHFEELRHLASPDARSSP